MLMRPVRFDLGAGGGRFGRFGDGGDWGLSGWGF